jgi:predicted dehydrogenase
VDAVSPTIAELQLLLRKRLQALSVVFVVVMSAITLVFFWSRVFPTLQRGEAVRVARVSVVCIERSARRRTDADRVKLNFLPSRFPNGARFQKSPGGCCRSSELLTVSMNTTARYNVGIIGYSWAATAHIAAISATGRGMVTDVWSSRPLDSAELSQRHGCAIRVHSDLEAMLNDPRIQVIDITSYPDQHPRHFIAAVQAGKHVIIEKPLAIDWKDIVHMRSVLDRSGLKTCVCFECRYSSQFLATKAVIDAGLLGSLHYGEIDYYHGIGPWYGQYRWNVKRDVGGSALLTAGCHALDAFLLCMGSDVEEVTSYSTQSANAIFKAYEYPTTSTTILKLRNGSIGKCAAVVDCLQPYYFHTHLIGSHGSLLDNRFHSQKLSGLNRQAWSQLSMKMLDSGDVVDHPYQTQFQAFFDALDRGEEMPLTSFADAFATHTIIEAADRSAAERRPVRIEEIDSAA